MDKLEELLAVLRNAKLAFPEQRVCQMLSNAMHYNGWESDDLFYVKDESLVVALKGYIKKHSRRQI